MSCVTRNREKQCFGGVVGAVTDICGRNYGGQVPNLTHPMMTIALQPQAKVEQHGIQVICVTVVGYVPHVNNINGSKFHDTQLRKEVKAKKPKMVEDGAAQMWL